MIPQLAVMERRKIRRRIERVGMVPYYGIILPPINAILPIIAAALVVAPPNGWDINNL